MNDLLPVVYAGHDIRASAREVPLFLSGCPPPTLSLHTQVGSNDFIIPVRAVITGGGYDEERFQLLYQACLKACGSAANLPVPFFRTNNELTDQLAREGKGHEHSSAEYPKAVTERLKSKLRAAGIAPGMQEEEFGLTGEVYFF
jgi:hypothetical protein